MEKYYMFFALLFCFAFSFAQNDNLLMNGGFEDGNVDSQENPAYNFKHNISVWESRTRIFRDKSTWHSPDWFSYYNNQTSHSGDGYVRFSDYELIQQKLDNALIIGNSYKMSFFFYNEEMESSDSPSTLKVFCSKQKMKYKNEFVFSIFNPDDYLCNPNYMSYRSNDYSVVKEVNLQNYPSREWIEVSFLFEVESDNYDWIAFDLNNNVDWEGVYTSCHITQYLRLDDIELTEHPYCNWEEEPCSPTDGPIDASFPFQVTNHSSIMVTGLDNVYSATDIKIYNLQSQFIHGLGDRYCINGIDTIVWNDPNIAPGYYVWRMNLENDCGSYTYWRGFIYYDNSFSSANIFPICNNSIQTPIPCCESEPDIYIENETIEGPGELSFHAINKIEVDNTTVEANTENLEMKAGNEIRLKPGTHIHQGAYAHFYIEPCATTNTHEALLPESTYSIPFAEVQNEKTENELVVDKFSIYPNPFSSKLHLSISYDYGSQIICEIYDLNGVLVFNETFNCRFSHCLETISTAHLKSGMYIVKLTGSDDIKSFKIIKQ